MNHGFFLSYPFVFVCGKSSCLAMYYSLIVSYSTRTNCASWFLRDIFWYGTGKTLEKSRPWVIAEPFRPNPHWTRTQIADNSFDVACVWCEHSHSQQSHSHLHLCLALRCLASSVDWTWQSKELFRHGLEPWQTCEDICSYKWLVAITTCLEEAVLAP